jgi:hypothetical protein
MSNNIEYFFINKMDDLYALPRLIKSTKSLPPNLLDIVSDYSGADSIEKIINNIDLFELNKVYEIVYYSNNFFDLLDYLHDKDPKYFNKYFCGPLICEKRLMIECGFHHPYKQYILHVTGQRQRDTFATDPIISMWIKKKITNSFE